MSDRGLVRVVVIGSECTGKTTLARALAAHYDAPWVPEYAREFVERKGAPPQATDVEAIARGQLAAEDAGARNAGRLLVLDTDLVSTLVYALHYYGTTPEWLVHEARARAADLYLFTGIDVPWQADGPQRDRGLHRDEMHRIFGSRLRELGSPLLELEGPHERRLALAIEAIDRLLEPPGT